MNFNGRTVGYAMITSAQIGKAVDEYLATNTNINGQPAAYLYNGLEMPPLPDWDKEARPYAFIYKYDSLYGAVYLYCAKEIQYKQGENYYTIGVVDSESFVCYPENEAPQWAQSSQSASMMIGNVAKTLWANFDVLNADGSVCLAASDPEPIYEEREFVLCTPQTLTPEQQAQARENIRVLTTIDMTDYGSGVTIADTIQVLILQGGGTAEVSGVGSLWDDVSVQGSIVVTFPFDTSTVRTASITTMAVGDYTTQICCGAICYHHVLGIMDVSLVINRGGGESATVMVFVQGAAT